MNRWTLAVSAVGLAYLLPGSVGPFEASILGVLLIGAAALDRLAEQSRAEEMADAISARVAVQIAERLEELKLE